MGPSKKMCNFYSMILFLAFINAITAEICQNNLCKCESQNRKYISIDCNCKGSKQGLDFTHSELQGPAFNEVNKVMVTNCEGPVSFRMDSFKDVTKLNILNIQNVRQVKFETGVFHQLTSLQLQNIQQLNFSKNAFNGAHGLTNIQIIKSSIPELPEYCFYKMEGLQRMTLTGVTINSIKRDSLNLQVPKININDCTINTIQENGMAFITSSFTINKLVMKEMASNSMNIISDMEVLILESEFETEVPANAISITAPMLNISSNTFKYFPTEIISNTNITNNGKIYFIGNTILEFQLEASIEKIIPFILKTEIKENNFPCKCSLIQSLNNLPNISPFGDNNFCVADCKISLVEVRDLIKNKRLCQRGPELDGNVICENRPTIPTTTITTTLPSTSREARYFTTMKAPTTDDNSSDRIQTASLNIILSSFAVAVVSHFLC